MPEKKFSRILSALLVLVMVLSMVPLTAFANEEKEASTPELSYRERLHQAFLTVDVHEVIARQNEQQTAQKKMPKRSVAVAVEYPNEEDDGHIHNEVASEKIDALCEDTGLTAGTYCSLCGKTLSGRIVIDARGHDIRTYEAKNPTFNSVGYEAYEDCARCAYSTYEEIPKLETPVLDNFEMFVFYLSFLEEIAEVYVMEFPGSDPLDLVIKYIRTGVERYNSGSWGIMAGYEDKQFAAYVAALEDELNMTVSSVDEMISIGSLKNLSNMELPNGEVSDIGHMFGTMDITYHNNYGTNHADVGGWAGDLVDLLEFSDYIGISGTLDEMIAQVEEKTFLKTAPEGVGGFNYLDLIGDLDALYLMKTIEKNGYAFELDVSGLYLMMMEYFTSELSIEDRAEFFLENRMNGVTVRSDLRDEIYNAYTNNKVVTTLEGTREFNSTDLDNLRKAVCYAYADYICKLAGDYVELGKNSLFSVFSTETANLAPGVTQQTKMATTASGKQIVYYLATADITREDVNLYANYHNNDPTQGWAMQRVQDQAEAAAARHSDPNSDLYIENYSVVAAVNGAGFNMETGEPSGVLVMEGVEYQSISSAGFVGILKDGTPVIGTKDEYNTIYKGQVKEAIACFGARLIKNGKIVEGLEDSLASRTAIGFTKTGKVVLLVLDGRQEPFSAGGGYATLAQILLEAGCVEAVNLDGGGSSTFVAKQPGADGLSLVNRPSDGYARSVSTSWMIVSTAPSSTTFDHAVIDSEFDSLTVGSSQQMTAVGVSPAGNGVDIPEGAVWAVDNDKRGSITEDGVFTALRNGSVDVYLMLDGEVIGSKTMTIVNPDNVIFTKANVDTVYGASVELPIKFYYQGKQIAGNAADVTLELSNSNAGSMDGLKFVANSDPSIGLTNVIVTATINSGASASIKVSLYKQGELTFDFDQATGGDRQLAWQRTVSNTTTEDNSMYIVVDPQQDMVTSYILAIDMTQLSVPEKLADLTYMLPGADIEGANAWSFLCQLAERISALSEIRAVVNYDPNFNVDISNLKLINEYFSLKSAEVDEENCTITLILNWNKRSQAIDHETANPMCIVNGITLTPKADAQWDSKNQIKAVITGSISYEIYMRASALYSFAQKPENQQVFGLYPYRNPDDSYDSGGYFENTYKEFYDSYTLVNRVKTGWYHEDSGYTYYVDGQKVTGVYQVDGYYYDFGEDGFNTGKTKYTGLLYQNGRGYYASAGELKSGWQTIGEDYYYFNPNTYVMHTGVSTIGGLKYTFNSEGVLVRGVFVETAKGTRYYWAGRVLVSRWIELEEGTYRADHDGYICYGNYPVILEGRKERTWYAFDEKTGLLQGICDGFIQREGQTYYCENGAIFYGAKEVDGGIIYCGTNGLVPVNGTCYISDSLDCTAGLEKGYYKVGPDGYIQKDGFATINGKVYFFNNYVRTKGFTEVDGKYYFFNTGNGVMQTDKNLWVSGSNPYGFASGYYYFQADGSMYVPDPNGEKKIVEKNGKLYFTIDGVNQTNGLNELDGEYYYANSNGTLAVNTVVYMSKFNDLIAPGNGYFAFDAEGKLVKDGFVKGTNGYSYYYDNLVRAKGFTKLGDKYYFFNGGSGAMECDKTLWVGGSNPYGITSGYYYFQADGTMYVPDPNGEKKIVEKNGKLYLTIDGVNQTNGLNELDGEYYYANSNGTLAVNTVVYMSKFNDLIAPGNGYFGFDAEGKLIRDGFVAAPNGYSYFYQDLVRVKGFTKLGDKYYFFNNGSGAMECNKTLWVPGSNPYGFVSGYYFFQEDGSMYVPDPNGEKKIVEKNGKLYFTIDGVNQTNGLNELDGEYYYANSNGTLAVNTVVYMSKFNDLIAPGNGYFGFDAEGKLIKNGFVKGTNGYTYYYIDLVRAKGFTKIGDDYYFFNTGSGAMQCDTKVWVPGSNPYGIKSGTYYFDANGKMVR